MSVSQEQKDRIMSIVEEVYETGFNDAMHIAKDMLTRDLAEVIDRKLEELRPDSVSVSEYEDEVNRLKDIIEEKRDDVERYRKMYLDERSKVEQTQKYIESLKAGSHTPLKNTYAWKAEPDEG